MIISKDSLGYVINNIDLLDLERHLKLLECFLEEYDVLLFAHFEQNIKSFIENLSQADKDFYYEGFCFGYIELYNQSTKIKIQEKIKELIFSKHYNSIFENCTESAKDRILSKIMNNDFEVHAIGTSTELRLSRALSREIEQTLHQFGEVLPSNVRLAYNRLSEHYAKQIQTENI